MNVNYGERYSIDKDFIDLFKKQLKRYDLVRLQMIQYAVDFEIGVQTGKIFVISDEELPFDV